MKFVIWGYHSSHISGWLATGTDLKYNTSCKCCNSFHLRHYQIIPLWPRTLRVSITFLFGSFIFPILSLLYMSILFPLPIYSFQLLFFPILFPNHASSCCFSWHHLPSYFLWLTWLRYLLCFRLCLWQTPCTTLRYTLRHSIASVHLSYYHPCI